MKYLGPAFLAVATMLCALTIAIAREGNQLGKYEWAVPYLAGIIVLCVILGVASLLWFGLHQEKKRDLPAPLPANQRNEQRVEANPQQIVNIGRDLFAPPTPIPQPVQPKQEEHPPNIQVGDSRIAKLRFIHHISSGLISWTEEPDGKQAGLLLCFRNQSIWGKNVKSARNVKAQLQYFFNDEEIGTGFRSAWLDTEYDLADLIVGGDAKCVVLLIQAEDGKLSIASKIRVHTSGYDRVNDRFTDLEKLPDIILIRLLDSNDQLLVPEVGLKLSGDDKGMLYTVT